MSLTIADALDYKGFPADRSKTGGWVPAALILGLFSHFVKYDLLAFVSKAFIDPSSPFHWIIDLAN